jgi:signal transduction histidine kinase
MMTAHRRTDKNILWVLAAGFAVAILSLLGSGFLGIEAMTTTERRSEALLAQHRISARLIDEIQGEEAGLSGLFYTLAASPLRADRRELLARLDAIEEDVNHTLQAAREGSNIQRWAGAKAAVERFIAEVRRVLDRSVEDRLGEPPASLYRAHEALVTEIAHLVSAKYDAAVEQEAAESAGQRVQLRRALALVGIALALAILCAVATVRVALNAFRRAEWQAGELSRLSGHVLDTQEQMLHRFSRELHDEFGQSLTAIEANLAAVPAESPEVVSRIEDCTLLIKDLMGNVRELSQLLRPSALDDFGLAPSLQLLADSFSQRTGILIERHLEFQGRLPGETETHLYRIAQEALTNVARHSGASRVVMLLREADGVLRLELADNGNGLKAQGSSSRRSKAQGGLGLAGMRERMRVAGGELRVRSGPNGVTVVAEVELDEPRQAQIHPSLVSG